MRLHKPNVCAKPPAPALPCREFPRDVNFRLFVHSNKDGAQAKCSADVTIYKTSNMCLNDPGFLLVSRQITSRILRKEGFRDMLNRWMLERNYLSSSRS